MSPRLNRNYENNASIIHVNTKKYLIYRMEVNEFTYDVLFDTGSPLTIVAAKHVDESIVKPRPDLNLKGAGNAFLNVIGETTIQFKINGHKFSHTAIVVRDLSQDIILGTDFLDHNEVDINYRFKRITAIVDGNEVLLMNIGGNPQLSKVQDVKTL